MVGDPEAAGLRGLRGARLFRGAPDALLAQFARQAVQARYAEGERLWRAGEIAHYFTIVQRGLVQIQRRAASGEPALLAVFGPTESIGDVAAIELGAYPADAQAVTQVEVVRVPALLVTASAEREPALARALQRALLEHTRALFAKIDIVSAGAVPARLATLLLHWHERFGDEDERGRAEVPIPLSRSALAHLVSARPETVIRALSAMQKSGVLAATQGSFTVLDLARLQALAGGRGSPTDS